MSFARASDYEPRLQDKIIGVFVVTALAVLVLLLLQRTYLSSYSGDWMRLHAVMTKAYGVTKGTIIELSGVTIGTVDAVVLQPDTRVGLELRFDRSQAGLLREGSSFKVNSQLGIDTVLSGVRLELIPGAGPALMKDRAEVDIVEPKSLDQVVEELKLDQLALQAKTIVANLETISTTIVQKQDEIAATLDNIHALSYSLNLVSAQLPQVLQDISATTRQVQYSLQQVDRDLATLTQPAADLLQSANASLTSVTQTLESMQPVVEQMPELLESAQLTALSFQSLANQLSSHWLLGGEGAVSTVMPGQFMLPDNALYSSGRTRTVPNPPSDRLNMESQTLRTFP